MVGDASQPQDGCLGGIDDRSKSVNALASERGDRERGAGHVIDRKGAPSDTVNKLGRLDGDGCRGLAVGVAHDRYHQSFVEGGGDADVDLGQEPYLITVEDGIEPA